MTGKELRKVLKAEPFQPFKIHLADGREFRVDHPEFLLHMPGARTFIVGCEDGTYEILDLLLVTSMTIGDGSKRRRRSRG